MTEPIPRPPKNAAELFDQSSAARDHEDQSDWVSTFRVSDLLARMSELGPNIAANEHFAKEVAPDELCREPGNGGRPLDPGYVENNVKARELFVNAIADGSLYRSPAVFSDYLKQSHVLAAAGDIYDRVGAGHLDTESIGVFRPADQGLTAGGSRREIAKQVAEIASRYRDPYAERFMAHRGAVSYTPHIAGMMHLPKDGRARDFAMGPDGAYLFSYPDGAYIPDYMARMTKLGGMIQDELRKEQPSSERAVRLIAEQYSLGAIIRPFRQINNSLFMNLANAQLKLFGLNGISHGILDHAAQRMRTDTFREYFADQVFGRTQEK